MIEINIIGVSIMKSRNKKSNHDVGLKSSEQKWPTRVALCGNEMAVFLYSRFD